MPRLKFKQKCKICKKEWVLVQYGQFTICVTCHMKQIAEEVTEKKYQFLNIEKELYEQSRFLRNIRQSYLKFKELSDKQIKTFKKTVGELRKSAE